MVHVMKIAVNTLLMLYMGFLGVQNDLNTNSDEKSKQKELINQYYQLNLKIFSKGSDIKDIESLFLLFTEDFTYVHREYGGVYTREELYNGYCRNLESGEYDGSIYDIRVFSVISGKDALAVSKRYLSKTHPNPQKEEGEMAVFEFRNGRIYRITEYW
jgi:ketosteroid isomerase-like protein